MSIRGLVAGPALIDRQRSTPTGLDLDQTFREFPAINSVRNRTVCPGMRAWPVLCLLERTNSGCQLLCRLSICFGCTSRETRHVSAKFTWPDRRVAAFFCHADHAIAR